MRQHLNAKKVRRLAEETGLDVVYVLVRGGTGHRQDLCLRDGTVVDRWPDGSLANDHWSDGRPIRHAIPPEEWLR